MRKMLNLTMIIVLATASLNAQDNASYQTGPPLLKDVLPSLSAVEKQALMNDGHIQRFYSHLMSPGLLPDTTLTATATRQLIAGNLNIGIERLFFTPIDQLPNAYASVSEEERTLKLYNILRSVSTLTGLEYYSASRKKMRLLFEESWALSSPENTQHPLPDPLVHTIPVEDSIAIHQKDKSFGKNQSEMTFLAHPDAFSATIVNLTPLRYKGLIKVVNPGNMQTHLIVVPVQEGLLIYGTMAANTRRVKLFLDRAKASFTTRVVALTSWYMSRLMEEF